jgi:(p)ppGpp synthase/HD superfamily hydrolase
MLPFSLFIQLDEDQQQALNYARRAHAGQTRSDKTAYIAHPERVAKSVMQFKKSHNIDALMSAAYLHDTIEDTNTTKDDLEKMFGALVASLVQELTSDKEEIAKVGKTEYLSQKMKKMTSPVKTRLKNKEEYPRLCLKNTHWKSITRYK